MRTRTFSVAMVLLACVVLGAGCSVRLTERDPARPYHYDERYDYTDLRVMTDRMAQSLLAKPPVSDRADRPIIVTYPIENRTAEHIDTGEEE